MLLVIYLDNVTIGIFVAEHKDWMKMKENLLIRHIIICIIKLQNML